tara:strand:- start:96 stop:263 length:168 start_codon:yes stop_codon:yes gene_type:complete
MTYTYKKCWDKILNQEAPCILRKEDHATIPKNPDNVDYQQYLLWAETNTIEEADK